MVDRFYVYHFFLMADGGTGHSQVKHKHVIKGNPSNPIYATISGPRQPNVHNHVGATLAT